MNRYNMFNRASEEGLLDDLEGEGIGGVAFCPLAQGLLTSRYLNGIPDDSRAGKGIVFLKKDAITDDIVCKIRALNAIALERGQSLAQMSLAWVLKDKRITSVIIGASRIEQIEDNVKTLKNLDFSAEELQRIEDILQNKPGA
jgi:L-glyceraldehyde 3-phosphate reductase